LYERNPIAAPAGAHPFIWPRQGNSICTRLELGANTFQGTDRKQGNNSRLGGSKNSMPGNPPKNERRNKDLEGIMVLTWILKYYMHFLYQAYNENARAADKFNPPPVELCN